MSAWEVAPVANIKSSVKRARTSAVEAKRNVARKTRVRSAVRKAKQALSGDPAQAQAAYREAAGVLDWGVAKGAVHRNAANRRKSRLARKLNAAAAAPTMEKKA